jgi:hypothetical protein
LLLWTQPFHIAQRSVCPGANSWDKRKDLIDGRGIREIGEKTAEKIDEKMC